MQIAQGHRKFTVYSLLVAVIITALLAASGVPAMAAPLPSSFSLVGKVTLLDGSTPVADASVLALQAATIPLKARANTDASGNYTLSLPAGGDWQVVVLPNEAIPTQSPTWVYTAGPQTVSVAGATPLNLTVTLATATISGQLLAPVVDPGATFTAGNKAAVRVVNQEGLGNTVQVTDDGHFTVNALPGAVQVRLALMNPLWAPDPTLAGSVWTAEASATLALPTATDSPSLLTLIKKQAIITGTVLDENDHPVPNIPIRAWRVDASEGATTLSDASGAFTLTVINGEWQMWAVPSESESFVSAESPKTVLLITPTASKAVVLHVVTADVTVTGTVVDQDGVAISPAPDGHVIPTYLDKDGIHWRQFANGAQIINGAFTLKLSSALSKSYRLHASFPNLQGYTEIFAPRLDLVTGTSTYSVTLPIAQDNSKISGHLVNQDKSPKTGLAAAIYAGSNGGAFAVRRVNPVDASYALDVAAADVNGHGGTTWWLHAFVDPTSMNGVVRPRTQKVFLPFNNGSGANVDNIDFTVVQLDSAIGGTVTDPNGIPLHGAKVGVWEQGMAAGTAFTRWVETDKNGKYLIAVPAGSYKVGADFARPFSPMISPVPALVTAVTGKTTAQDLAFRKADAWIGGSVTYADGSSTPVPHAAMVRAYTTDGAHTWALAVGPDASGNFVYALHVIAGQPWHIQAVSEEGDIFLKSDPILVTPKKGLNPNNDLVLKAVDRLPGAVVFTFDATQDQVLTLSDGAQVIIPANAMATSGQVMVVIRPLPEVADDGVATPVSFGYRLLAFDSFMTPIDHFNSPVTLVMPYTAAQLTALGVTPANLIPSYWDLGTNSFKPVPDYTVVQNPVGSGSLNLAVMHFTDYALVSGTNPAYINFPQYSAYLPAVSK